MRIIKRQRGTHRDCTWRSERGQALIEFALTLPVFCTLLVGTIKGGMVFNNWVILTNAVSVGARTLAISRSTSGATGADACQAARTSLVNAAAGLSSANITVTWSVTNSCTNLAAGSSATLTATYPCNLSIMGVNFSPSCTLTARTTERVE